MAIRTIREQDGEARPGLTSKQVWQAVTRASFAVLSHITPAVGSDMLGLPAARRDRDHQPSADDLVHHAAGPGFAGRRDVTEHSERGPGDPLPHLLAGQPWPGLALLFTDSPDRHDRASRCVPLPSPP